MQLHARYNKHLLLRTSCLVLHFPIPQASFVFDEQHYYCPKAAGCAGFSANCKAAPEQSGARNSRNHS